MTVAPTPLIARLERAADRGRTERRSSRTDRRVLVPWAQLHDEARVVGAGLQARGIAPGDHVAILGPTSRALVTAIQGVLAGRRALDGAAAADADGVARGVRRARPGPASATATPSSLLIDDRARAVLRAGAAATRRSRRCGPIACPGRGAPERRALEHAGARPRAARHPAVHERLDERAEGRDDPRPGARAPTSTPSPRRPSTARRRAT